jgi:uncharacterized UBP type Zn finger protein
MNHELSNLNPSKKNNFRKKNRRIDQTTNKILTYNYFKTDFTENNNSKIAKIFFFTIESNTFCQGCNILKYNYQALYLLEFHLE